MSQTVNKRLFSPEGGRIAFSANERIAEFLGFAIQAEFAYVNKLRAVMPLAFLLYGELREIACGIIGENAALQSGDVVLLHESCALADLSFAGFLALVVGRIAGVNNGFHRVNFI